MTYESATNVSVDFAPLFVSVCGSSHHWEPDSFDESSQDTPCDHTSGWPGSIEIEAAVMQLSCIMKGLANQ